MQETFQILCTRWHYGGGGREEGGGGGGGGEKKEGGGGGEEEEEEAAGKFYDHTQFAAVKTTEAAHPANDSGFAHSSEHSKHSHWYQCIVYLKINTWLSQKLTVL